MLFSTIVHVKDAIGTRVTEDPITHDEAIEFLLNLRLEGDELARLMLSQEADYYVLNDGSALVWF